MSDFVAPNTEYMEGKLKILWFPKITNVKEVQTVLPIAPCYENKTRSQKLNLDNKCFQQLWKHHYKAVTVLAACSERLIVFKKG